MNLIRGRAALVAALIGAAALAACDGSDNPFRPVPGGGGTGGGGEGTPDKTPPTVSIVLPNETTRTIAVGDSLFVQARVADAGGLGLVTVEGYAIRGSAELGTAKRVDRWFTKTVDLGKLDRVVRDTTISRFLNATEDSVPEGDVFVVVTAKDSSGNAAADTFQLAVGGPRVSVEKVTPSDDPAGGSQMTLRVTASDPRDLLNSVTVRGAGAFEFQQAITFSPARAEFDSTLVIPIPQAAVGTVQVTASTVSGSNQTGVAVLSVNVRAAAVDNLAPRVTFSSEIAARVEQTDSFSVSVTAVDETRVDSVGVTVLAIRRGTADPDTLRVFTGRGAVAGGTFRFGFDAVGLSHLDTATIDLEVTAWARDPAGNCGAATTPNTPQQLACTAGPQGSRLSTGPGRLAVVYIARGRTLARPNGSDVIADLVADDNFVYLSNLTRNRVEVLPLGGSQYGTPVRVGSAPWGLALGRNRDSLYVANSGGTNISVVPLGGAVLQEAENRRLFPRNELLFGVDFNPVTLAVGSVALFDYSDRPQFLGQASNGLLVYSTRPTASAKDGTVRIYDPRKLRSEIFTGYVDRHTSGKAIAVNADSAFHIAPGGIMVCPRRRFGDTTDPQCIAGNVLDVSDSLQTLRTLPPNASGGRYDTRLDIGADIAEVGFADTTFVATSTDRRYVAVGEGVRTNARIPMFEALGDSLVLRGDVRDLISNTAERVIGLGINRDGTLGVARGAQVYFFTDRLRLQGTMQSGAATGGVAMHPQNADYPLSTANRLAFVSGTENGRPYIDVLDAFYFSSVKRIYLRDPVVGALVVAPRAPGDAANVNLRLYALTTTGVLGIAITNEDLQ